MRKHLFVALAVLAAVFAALVATQPASASVPPDPGSNPQCYVYQNIYPSKTGVTLEQHVYHCNYEALVGERLTFARDNTTLKTVTKSAAVCQSSKKTLGNCVRDYTYSFANPSGSQSWHVCSDVVWTGAIAKIAEYKNCYTRKL